MESNKFISEKRIKELEQKLKDLEFNELNMLKAKDSLINCLNKPGFAQKYIADYNFYLELYYEEAANIVEECTLFYF